MKNIISKLNKSFENRVRLGIMSVLMVNDRMDFINLRDLLDVTDGNLASHLRALEESKYIRSKKRFIDKKPNTVYFITSEGETAFKRHIKALEKLLDNI